MSAGDAKHHAVATDPRGKISTNGCDGKHESALRLRDRALHATSSGIVIARCDVPGNPIEYVNPAFERITGYRAEEVLGADCCLLAAPGLDEAGQAELASAVRERCPLTLTLRNRRKSGELFWNELSITPFAAENDVVTHFIAVLTDVTVRHQRTRRLEHETTHDTLTGLANRNLLWDRIEQALNVAQRNKSLVVTVLVDLNRFRLINEHWGQLGGDEVLKAIAKRLTASVREGDTVARLSADEFVLVLADQPSMHFALRVIDRVCARVARPVAYGSTEIPVAASIGVSVYPHDGETSFDLVRSADIAMSHAKSNGATEVSFFSGDMKLTSEARERFKAEMRGALERGEYFLLYQPRMSLKTGGVVSIEALLRWRHPEQGILLPPAFLPDAEDNGIIVPIGRWVLDQLCARMVHLRAAGHENLSVAMNTSYRQFSQPHYIAELCEQLKQNSLDPATLELELREEEILCNRELSRELALDAKTRGLKLSIVNFGDGLTSLSELQALQATKLKMNPAVVRTLDSDSHSATLTKALIDIAHNLGMTAAAANVETKAQSAFLKDHGCDEMQGHLFSKPLSCDALDELLATAARA